MKTKVERRPEKAHVSEACLESTIIDLQKDREGCAFKTVFCNVPEAESVECVYMTEFLKNLFH